MCLGLEGLFSLVKRIRSRCKILIQNIESLSSLPLHSSAAADKCCRVHILVSCVCGHLFLFHSFLHWAPNGIASFPLFSQSPIQTFQKLTACAVLAPPPSYLSGYFSFKAKLVSSPGTLYYHLHCSPHYSLSPHLRSSGWVTRTWYIITYSWCDLETGLILLLLCLLAWFQ